MITKYIFITGGVVSSLGKGLTSASLGALLQAQGYKVRFKKLDPYLNVDPGTMSPYQHGEVFVTDDGGETDLDFGHYERFTTITAKKTDSTTAGRIYSELITKERRGDYLGGTVQVIPHVTDLIKNFIKQDVKNEDFVLCEIGGTVGDIEALPFFEAIRQIRYELGSSQTMFIHLTLVPYIATAHELKTKPTQHSVKELRSIGIQPNILLCRSDRKIPSPELKKMALFCNVPEECVIQAIDQKTIYEVPISYHSQGLDKEVLNYFNLPISEKVDLTKWETIVKSIQNPKQDVTIAVVGKYNNLKDAYKSLIEAFNHAGIYHNCRVKLLWVNSVNLNIDNISKKLQDADGIMVPGGFGNRGVEGKILAINYAREKQIPFFGICLGMQLAAIEIARNILNIPDASSTEFTDNCTSIIGLLTEWDNNSELERRGSQEDLGGSMRLGSYRCHLKNGSLANKVYGVNSISERHRHRYEFNNNYKKAFEDNNVLFSGVSTDGKLMEILELPDHPWFVGVQFHPELKSKPFDPHPLFVSFVEACL
jgi:CTP synthase